MGSGRLARGLQGVQVSCQKSFFGSEKCRKKSNSLLTRKIAEIDTIAAEPSKRLRTAARALKIDIAYLTIFRFGTPFATRARAGYYRPKIFRKLSRIVLDFRRAIADTSGIESQALNRKEHP